jgi:rhodanese-related sulfurtransferase
MIKSTNAAELHQWLQAGAAVLVDVRQPEEYAEARIAGAVLIPLAGLTADRLPAFADKKLVMQCHVGGRSRTACGMLAKEIAGLEVYNLEGGIVAWAQAGLPVEA